MKKLIEVSKSTIGNKEVDAVSARELYLGLGLATQHWAAWSKTNIESNEFFSQGIDFVQLPTMGSVNIPNPPKDYAISIEFAKHISLMAKTQKGHEYRGYFLELEKQPSKTAQLPSFADAVAGVEAVANYLRLSESGRIAFIKPVIEQYGVAIQLPAYAIDAPPSLTAVSSLPTNSATALLKEHGVGMSAVSFNKILESLGIIETLSRKSSKGDKHYKSVTKYGLIYGKNVTSPSNAKETQPHWYIHKFSELLNLVMNKHAANLKLQ